MCHLVIEENEEKEEKEKGGNENFLSWYMPVYFLFCACCPPNVKYILLSSINEIQGLKACIFLTMFPLDEMGNRIDELEQSINDLRAEMGQEGSPSPSAQPKSKDEPKSADDSA